jgi:hypothetical protein
MESFISLSGQGELIAMKPGDEVHYRVYSKQTDGTFELFEREVPPHSIAADPHIHQKSTETLYKFAGNPINICG